ncbi:MAG: hypothetical protein ACREMU_06975, partial [Gemmatimonadaceae bacterium]
VSILGGAVIEGSTIRDTLIGAGARISDCVLSDSLVADDVVLEGVRGSVTIGDQGEVRSRIR